MVDGRCRCDSGTRGLKLECSRSWRNSLINGIYLLSVHVAWDVVTPGRPSLMMSSGLTKSSKVIEYGPMKACHGNWNVILTVLLTNARHVYRISDVDTYYFQLLYFCLSSQSGLPCQSIEKYTHRICIWKIYYGGMMTEISISCYRKCCEISRDFVGHFEWCHLAKQW